MILKRNTALHASIRDRIAMLAWQPHSLEKGRKWSLSDVAGVAGRVAGCRPRFFDPHPRECSESCDLSRIRGLPRVSLRRSLPPASLLCCLPCCWVRAFSIPFCTAAPRGALDAGVRRGKKVRSRWRQGGGEGLRRGWGVVWDLWVRAYLLGARSKATNALMIKERQPEHEAQNSKDGFDHHRFQTPG